MGSQARNHQNNSSCTVLPYGGRYVSCVGKVSKLDPPQYEECRSITGSLRPASVENVYILVGIAPPDVRRATTSRQEGRSQLYRCQQTIAGSVPQRLIDIPSEDLGPASKVPWLYWKCLNKLRTGMGHCMSNMQQWKYSDTDTMCYCGGADTMDYMLKWPMLSREYTTEDLMEYNKAAKERVFQCYEQCDNVTPQEEFKVHCAFVTSSIQPGLGVDLP